MLIELALLESNAVLAWFDRDCQASTSEVAAALAAKIGALKDDVVVVHHYPERFLVRFVHRHHAELAAGRHDIPFGNTKLQLRAWRMEKHAEHVDMGHHVRLCLEGLPLYAWDEQAVANAIGSGCSLDYIEPASKLKTATKVLALWAWTPCPSKVPRLRWITLPARTDGAPVYGRKGLEHRVLVHLDIHEDPTSGEIVSRPNVWRYNVVDGESRARDRRERISRPVRHERRDRDDEEDRDRGRGRDGRDASRGDQGWGARIRRSLSHAPRDGHRDGRRGTRDGRRRTSSPLPVAVPSSSPPLLGSGSMSVPAVQAIELLPIPHAQLPSGALPAADAGLRGRSPVRRARPESARRQSREALTPPAWPPHSPTTVLRAPRSSKRDAARVAATLGQERSPALIELCSPTTMLRPLISTSPVRPPGFEASPTPPLLNRGALHCTPTSPRARLHAADDALPAGLAALVVPRPSLDLPDQLFCVRQPAVLPTPVPQPPLSSPTKRQAARRKTLAGVKISTAGGLSLQRVRRAPMRAPDVPAAKKAESLICRSLGITRDGQDVIEDTLKAFTDKFKQHLPDEVIIAMRDFFELDNPTVNAIEDALIGLGGEGVLDQAAGATGLQDGGGQDVMA